MKLKIEEKKEAPLLYRTEILANIEFDAQTPSTEEVKKQMSSSLKTDENLLVVKSIYTKFGRKYAHVTAYLYKDLDSLIKIEPKKKKKKEAEKTEEKPQEAKKPKEAK